MDPLNAKSERLKQKNLSFIRRMIKTKCTVTRAELVTATKMSATTVRALLAERMQNQEIESVGQDLSSGGRKTERYRFKRDRYYGVALCMAEHQVNALLVDLCGTIIETTQLSGVEGNFEPALFSFLDALVLQKEIKAIGIGAPGVVDGTRFWRKDVQSGALYEVPIGETLAQRYGIPVILENDLNAIAIGFGRCYEREFPRENPEHTNMAYLHFEHGCVSAGFIAGGRILRGANNFSGELGLIPMEDGNPLDASMATPIGDRQYTNLMVQMIAWICGILNPQYVALGGPGLRKDCIGPIGDALFALLPKPMFAEILYAPDVWHDYQDGMAYLTAEKMFDEVQFTKESFNRR